MKLLNRSFTKDGEGHVKLVPEEAEDMWHAYNLIREGDRLTATTFRKVARDLGTGTDNERVKIKLTIAVEGVDFDAEGGVIRVRGRNVEENDHVKVGAYHSLELEEQRAFTLFKVQWDAVDIDRVVSATNPAQSADLAAVLITEGLAHVCLVGGATTLTQAKLEANLPRKRGPAIAGYDKAYNKFQESVLQAILRHVDFDVVKCLVLAGPGFAKDSLKQYMDLEAVRRDLRPLIENKDKVVLAPASSAYKHALQEVLANPLIASRVKNTMASREVEALRAFMAMLSSDSARAFYGPGHVFAANDMGAIQTLLISDSLFRINNVQKRKRYVGLVDAVKDGGGEALIFSSMHVSGEQLNQLSGIAAVLRFPLPDLEDQELPEEA
ncbi:meiotic cell division protein pelota [Haematococcus lacustris]